MKKSIFISLILTAFLGVSAFEMSAQTTKTVKVYLLVGGKGDIKCPTKLVPVTRKIAATQSILRATLEELFSMPFGGKRGVNWTHGMQIDSINLKNGTAFIKINKENGEGNSQCWSLFSNQIEKTARQFPSVKKVEIDFVD